MIAEVDDDNSGKIEFEEFVALMLKKTKETNLKEELVQAFKVFDREGNNYVTMI